eukprot:6483126-Pyramimonas_sp.AAC.1
MGHARLVYFGAWQEARPMHLLLAAPTPRGSPGGLGDYAPLHGEPVEVSSDDGECIVRRPRGSRYGGAKLTALLGKGGN